MKKYLVILSALLCSSVFAAGCHSENKVKFSSKMVHGHQIITRTEYKHINKHWKTIDKIHAEVHKHKIK